MRDQLFTVDLEPLRPFTYFKGDRFVIIKGHFFAFLLMNCGSWANGAESASQFVDAVHCHYELSGIPGGYDAPFGVIVPDRDGKSFNAFNNSDAYVCNLPPLPPTKENSNGSSRVLGGALIEVQIGPTLPVRMFYAPDTIDIAHPMLMIFPVGGSMDPKGAKFQKVSCTKTTDPRRVYSLDENLKARIAKVFEETNKRRQGNAFSKAEMDRFARALKECAKHKTVEDVVREELIKFEPVPSSAGPRSVR